MTTKELLDFIGKSFQDDYSEDEVRQSLVKIGWKPADIDEGFALARANKEVAPSPPATPPPARPPQGPSLGMQPKPQMEQTAMPDMPPVKAPPMATSQPMRQNLGQAPSASSGFPIPQPQRPTEQAPSTSSGQAPRVPQQNFSGSPRPGQVPQAIRSDLGQAPSTSPGQAPGAMGQPNRPPISGSPLGQRPQPDLPPRPSAPSGPGIIKSATGVPPRPMVQMQGQMPRPGIAPQSGMPPAGLASLPGKQMPAVVPKKKGKLGRVIVLLFVLAILGAGGYGAYLYWDSISSYIPFLSRSSGTENVESTVPPEFTPPAPEPADELAGWQTYTNEEFGFELKYPSEWELEDFISHPELRGLALKRFTDAQLDFGWDGALLNLNFPALIHPATGAEYTPRTDEQLMTSAARSESAETEIFSQNFPGGVEWRGYKSQEAIPEEELATIGFSGDIGGFQPFIEFVEADAQLPSGQPIQLTWEHFDFTNNGLNADTYLLPLLSTFKFTDAMEEKGGAMMEKDEAMTLPPDEQRLADLLDIQESLGLYFSQLGSYPATTGGEALSCTDQFDCFSKIEELLVWAGADAVAVPHDPRSEKDGASGFEGDYGYESDGESYILSAYLDDPQPGGYKIPKLPSYVSKGTQCGLYIGTSGVYNAYCVLE